MSFCHHRQTRHWYKLIGFWGGVDPFSFDFHHFINTFNHFSVNASSYKFRITLHLSEWLFGDFSSKRAQVVCSMRFVSGVMKYKNRFCFLRDKRQRKQNNIPKHFSPPFGIRKVFNKNGMFDAWYFKWQKCSSNAHQRKVWNGIFQNIFKNGT